MAPLGLENGEAHEILELPPPEDVMAQSPLPSHPDLLHDTA